MYNDDDLDINITIDICEYLYTVLDFIKKEKWNIDQKLDDFQGDWSIIQAFKDWLNDYNS